MAKTTHVREPKSLGLILTAFSGCVLGACLAVSVLLATPANRASSGVSGDQKFSDFSATFHSGVAAGTESNALKANFRRLENQMNGDLTFSEADINYFLLQSAPKVEGEEKLRVGAPNLKIGEDKSILSLSVLVDPTGENFEMLIQMHGHFEMSENGPVFVTDTTYLNSFKVPLVGGIIGSSLTKWLAEVGVPEKLFLGWKSISTFTTEKGNLSVTVGESTS